MNGYYEEKLAAENLRRCYEVAPPRVQQYLEAELRHVMDRIRPGDVVLDLGCGYGRTLVRLAPLCGALVGIDSSLASLQMGTNGLQGTRNCHVAQMNAAALAFADDSFDVVVCIQNGISAFHVDRPTLVAESLRVARPGGRVLFSSYAEQFWDDRLEWFRLQSQHGLLGEIDEEATGNGVIVCKDGFKATTVGADEFTSLATHCGGRAHIEFVDGSSVFCEFVK